MLYLLNIRLLQQKKIFMKSISFIVTNIKNILAVIIIKIKTSQDLSASEIFVCEINIYWINKETQAPWGD